MNDLKLERFKKESNTPNIKILLISFSVLLFFTLYFMIYKSHAFYRLTESNDVIKAKIGSYVYNINYDLDGGILPDGVSNPSTYSSVEETTITNPVKEGYTFKGWEGFSRNLFDRDKAIENKALVWVSGNTGDDAGSLSSDYIAVKKGMSYVSKYSMQVILYDQNKNYIKQYDNYNVERKKFTIDNNNDAYYVRICFRKLTDVNMTTIDDLQLEEGDTATEYEPHLKKDLVIPKFTKGDISLKAIWEPSTYTVTFDANGGTVDTASKEVKYHENYDNLPTPVREGYTFLGWNGKNLFDVDSVINQNFVKNADNTYTITKNSDSQRYAGTLLITIPANTSFYTSWELVDYNGTYSAPFQMYGQLSDYSSFYVTRGMRTLSQDTRSFTIYQEGSMPDGTYTTIKNLMIELGETQTEYEPYYITSDTTVVQANDHTLKAIWRQN